VAIEPDALDLTYTPDADYYGQDYFTYTIDDGHGATAMAMVTVTVTNIDDAPIADAGADQSVKTSVEGQPVIVTLDGSGSYDLDDDPLSYDWRQIGGQAFVALADDSAATTTFTAPSAPDVLDFRLRVEDPYTRVSDRVTITITNRPPTADAGPDQSVDTGDTVRLNGSGHDPEGRPLRHEWVQIPVPTVDLEPNSRVASPTFTAPSEQSTLGFRLYVTDTWDAVASDTVFVGVSNRPPQANAGADRGVAVNAIVTLDGRLSFDPDGHVPLTYTWKQIGGPPQLLSDPAVVNPTFTASDAPTVLTFTLSVTDSDGLPADPPSDDVTIRVTYPPIANAGPDRTVDIRSLVTLDGSGSRDQDENLPLRYHWIQEPGGEPVTLTNPMNVTSTFVAPITPTVLTFTLVVTDDLDVPNARLEQVVIDVQWFHAYLPSILSIAPDLVVQSFQATGQDVQVVIANQGSAPPVKPFFVFVYIDPDTDPTAVNQLWGSKGLGGKGIAWAIPSTVARSVLVPGGSLTLECGDEYYQDDWTSKEWSLTGSTRLFAHVDAYREETDYGYVLETHEISGGPYNNILGPIHPTAAIVTKVGLPVERGARRGPRHLPLGP
jgi:hypothetical protein